MLNIVRYEPEHLKAIELRECHLGERPAEIPGPAVTFLDQGAPVAILGWVFITDRVVQVWALLSDGITRKRLSFHRAVRNLIEFGFERNNLQRMQFSVKVGYMAGWHWARSLGFTCEGIMRRYGADGADCWLFARVAG